VTRGSRIFLLNHHETAKLAAVPESIAGTIPSLPNQIINGRLAKLPKNDPAIAIFAKLPMRRVPMISASRDDAINRRKTAIDMLATAT
jgi:hypothetical protein